MNKVIALLVVLSFSGALAAAEGADPIADATEHARIDAASYHANGWVALAFGVSLFGSPLIGGVGVIVAANLADPDIQLPTARVAWAQKTYDNTDKLVLYRSQYRESMAGPVKKDRARRAWIGTGLALGAYVAAIAAYVFLSQ